MALSLRLSFASCLRHAFMTGAGYGDLQKISDYDQKRWVGYTPPDVGAFKRMDTAFDVHQEILNALKGLYETVGNRYFDGDQLAEMDAAMITARDAIAKAEARS